LGKSKAIMSNDSVKRIMAEVRELSALNAQPGSLFQASPLETDLFEWHFTVRGPPDTPFEAGLYHGRIILPVEYPLKAPEIILLTPNGRFEVGTRICLSVTSHHNETWQPSWGIRTILTALIGFMPSKSEGLGALDYPAEDRQNLARKSFGFQCPRCGVRPADQFKNYLQVGASSPESRNESQASSSSTSEGPSEEASAPSQMVVAQKHCGSASLPGTRGSEPPMVAQSDKEVQPSAMRVPAPSGPDTPAVVPQSAVATAAPKQMSRNGSRRIGQEKELLYLAYAIAVAILAIIARRIANVAL
jgi:ubiquitin-conjugating enzyme E2 J1